jgi:serine/threonine protein kinase
MIWQVGTPQYMAPEMHAGREYSHAADVWALGCLLYELAALQPLFAELDEAAIARKVRPGQSCSPTVSHNIPATLFPKAWIGRKLTHIWVAVLAHAAVMCRHLLLPFGPGPAQVCAMQFPPALPSQHSLELQLLLNRMLQQDPAARPTVDTILASPQLQVCGASGVNACAG